MADKPQDTKELSPAEQRRQQNEAINKRRENEIDGLKITDEEKKILKLYEKGTQTYAIAKEVYKFVNQDTVGQVILTIRKHYADDWNEVESINSTKGYSGI